MSAQPVEPLHASVGRPGAGSGTGSRSGTAPGRAVGRPRPTGAQRALGDEEIAALRRRAAAAEVSPALEEELSVALGLAHELKGIDDAAARLGFIFDCLLAEPPKLALAQDERLRLQVENHRHAGWFTGTLARVSAGSPVALVLLALGLSLVIWAVAFAVLGLMARHDQESALRAVDMTALATVSYAAVVGGILSIATRLKAFSRVRDLDPFAMFWTALLKPLIGVLLAIFILAALFGGVVSLGTLLDDNAFAGYGTADGLAPQTIHVLWVIGFLAGFSERFAWDFVDRAQNRFGDDSKPGAEAKTKT